MVYYNFAKKTGACFLSLALCATQVPYAGLAFAQDSTQEAVVASVGSYEVGQQIEVEGSNLYYKVLDVENGLVGIGTGDSAESSYGNGFINCSFPEDHNLVVPASVTDSNGKTWKVSAILPAAFRAKSNTDYVSNVVIEAQLDSIGAFAFAGFQNQTRFDGLQLSEAASVKEIDLSAFSVTIADEIIIPEGTNLVRTNSGAAGGPQGAAVKLYAYPLSYNGKIYCAASNISLVVKSPYATFSSGKNNSYSNVARATSTFYYVWPDSIALKSMLDDSKIPFTGTPRVAPRVMATLSSTYEPAAVAPEGTEKYVSSCNVEVTGIVDGGTYVDLPAATISCTDNSYGWTLTEGTDFTASYYDADGVKLDGAPSVPGTYSVEYVGNEKTAWGTTQRFSFTIDPDISAAEIAADQTMFTYNGEGQAPELQVTLNGKSLVQGTNYNVTYIGVDNQYSGSDKPSDAGRYAAVVSAKSPSEGLLKQVEFSISPVDVSVMYVANAAVADDGSAVTPAITAYDTSGAKLPPAVWADKVTYTDASGALVAPEDLKTAGAYTATFTGDDKSVKGSVSAAFNIINTGKKLASAELSGTLSYTSKTLEPSFVVKDADGNEVGASDYVVRCYTDSDGNEVKASELVDSGTYTATIEATGSTYTGSIACAFTVGSASAEGVKVTINQTSYDYVPTAAYYKGLGGVYTSGEELTHASQAITPDVTVSLEDGTVLTAGADYDVVFLDADNDGQPDDIIPSNKDTQANTAVFKVVLKGNYSGEITGEGLKVTVNKRTERTYEYNGVKFSYALVDGKAVITGLGVDITVDNKATAVPTAYTSAFDNETITIPGAIKDGDKTYPVTGVSDIAFSLPSKVGTGWTAGVDTLNGAKKLVFEEGIQSIGESAFDCRNIESAELPSTLKTIGALGLSGLSVNAKTITIPKNVEFIGSGAFGGNLSSSKLESIVFEEGSHFSSTSNEAWMLSGTTEYTVRHTLYGYILDGGAYPSIETSGYAPATMLVVPASYASVDMLFYDFGNVNDLCLMGDQIEGLVSASSLFYCSQRQKSVNLWTWDVAGTRAPEVVSANGCFSTYKPFAVLGESYTYDYGFDAEHPELGSNVQKTYNGNVSVGTPVATVTGSEVTVDWNLQLNFANAAYAWTPVEGTDFTVSYADAQGNPVDSIAEPGTYTATLTGNGKTCFGSQTAQVVVGGIAITDSCVSASGEGLTYNGSAQDATSVKVTVDGALLEEGADYTVAYTDNVNAGTATATVTGKGLYAGTAKATYEIAKAPLTITASSATKTVGGAEPELGYTPEGLVGGDVIAYAKVTREAGETAGSYAVKVSGAIVLNADGTALETANYAINYVDGTLTVEKAPATGVEGFVERLYTNVMGRTASQEEVDFQANAMGTYGAAQITYNFYNSDEFKAKAEGMTNAEIVENVYQTMLGRTADEGGLAMWTKYLDNGMSACALVAGFAESGEFGDVCSGYGIGTGSADQLRSMLEYRDRNAGVTAFASRMYTIVLSRDAEVAGLNVQCEALIGGTPCYQIALNFFDGDEYVNKAKSDSEFVADCYKAMMDREGSESEIAAWVDRMADEGLTRSAVVKGFCQSDEFEKICQDCGMTSGMR